MVDLAEKLIVGVPIPIRQKIHDFLRSEILFNPIPAGEHLVQGHAAL